jgi:AcrR family transcriptional regulator
MPPTERVSRDAILVAATSLIEREGLAALTARRVAGELGVSTAPVYRQFDSMDELAHAVMERARDLLLTYTRRVYTDNEWPFLDIGTGVGVFAREHSSLYRALFLESNQFEGLLASFLDRLTDEMRRDARFSRMDRAMRAVLLERMWTYTHGLAATIAVGLAKDTATESIVRSLETVGGAVIRDVLAATKRARPRSARRAR